MDYSRLIDFIQTMALPDSERQDLLTLLNDVNMSEDQKKEKVLSFISAKELEMDKKLEVISLKVKQDTLSSMDIVDKEFNAKLDALSSDVEIISSDLEKHVDSL
jgi:hypothetical protein